jgi:hypothetical protein
MLFAEGTGSIKWFHIPLIGPEHANVANVSMLRSRGFVLMMLQPRMTIYVFSNDDCRIEIVPAFLN